ncbi:MspA family porin [Rhodococcus sp. BP-252]|uniref:MspA family porin n=1 Tax=unclassified Rhodococcus (in: high G+C Gram-positive bacteria) TaxID=192944 RepID=UPI001C9A88B2|nr:MULTISPECIES: MspA family porin [unclassified Rhodococcus (in: high G+C Gram-positive bacteria)]MBY6414576.1 MspA family porin [Rhodococcus sp. BP-320]MBY6419333.1 MspA family porin [Rhodococcus sp. BP-321]MBY6424315.1 MspA family porin [Rhodococcus sp. BP-324]MBY6429412.1 MspA family porin [Rhodococcus sp. BP-323]MBY6431931.1 MspA family porin [Rhodococcus sp. BP-322]
MTEIQKPRRSRGLKSLGATVVAGASVAGLVLGTGTASAAVDSTNTVVDANGNTITVSLSDTFINSVPPLDGNPLTREWFANGVAGWTVTGPDADDFEGTVTVGYQVGYPASLGGSITFGYSTPNFSIGGKSSSNAAGPNGGESSFSTNDLLPSLGFEAEIAPGPGIVDAVGASGNVQGTEGDAEGPSGTIQIANVHGTATGILGNVRVRPYVSVTSSTGDVAVTYGQPWVFN